MDQVIAPQARLVAGAANVDITPPVGMYHRMWGAAIHDRSTGVHRPLVATGLWLAPADGDAGEAMLLIALDHCILERAEADRVRAAAARGADIAAEQVHVCLSHTHAAGFMSRSRADLPGGDQIGPYLDRMAEQVGKLAAEAKRLAAPAVLTAAYGRCDLAKHRDYFDTQTDKYVCGFNPHADGDDTLVVARITTGDGPEHAKPLATLVNYACHPTTLAWQNTLVSPDFVGAMRETIEASFPGPCFFLQGASGDLGPREGFVGDTAVADRNGRQLGHAAVAALETLPPPQTRFVYTGPVVSGATLGTWRHEPLAKTEAATTETFRTRTANLSLEYRPGLPTVAETRRELAEWQAAEAEARQAGDEAKLSEVRARTERVTRRLSRLTLLPEGKQFPYTFTVARTGGLLWVIAPGELYQVLQIELRRRFRNFVVVVATVSDDWQPGYLPKAATYGLGIYQEEIAVVAPGSLEILIERLATELEGLIRA
jgi:hypothetical protein